MKSWIKNGVRLAWLIHPQRRMTYIFKEDSLKEALPFDSKLSGEKVLPNFSLRLSSIFE